MADSRARAVLLGLVLALCAAVSPAAASLPDPHGLAGGDLADHRVLELLRETEAAAPTLPEPAAAPAFTLWPEPPPPDGQLFARTPEPPLLEPAVRGLRTALEEAGSLPETRVRAFGLFEPYLRLGSSGVSRETATRYTLGLRETYVGPTQKGLWTDPVTGLAYARARWYDARNATWLSEDPLFDRDSPNLYAFVAWQPTMGTDPMGRQSPVQVAQEMVTPVAANDNYVRPALRLISGGAAGGAAAASSATTTISTLAGTSVTAAPVLVTGGVVVGGFGVGYAAGRGIGHIPTGGGKTVDDRVRGLLLRLLLSKEELNDSFETNPYAPRPGSRPGEEWTPLFDASGNVVQYLRQPSGHNVESLPSDARGSGETALMRHPFSDGGSHITTTARLARFLASPTYGGPSGLYVSPLHQVDEILLRATSRHDLEVALGLEQGALEGGLLVRVDVQDPLARNLRFPDPSTGNIHHRPGTGLTTGGLNEATIDSPLKTDPRVQVTILGGGR